MSELGPTRTMPAERNGKAERNGDGAEPKNGAAVTDVPLQLAPSLHGGAADGLPVAAPSAAHSTGNGNGHANGVVESDEQAANGNGAGWSAVKLPYNPQPEMELSLPEGGGTVALTSVLESLLFVAGEAVEVSHLAKSLDLRAEEVKAGLVLLAEQYKAQGGGLRVQVHNERYQLVTSPATAPFVEEFLNVDVSTKLSSAALETLAIVAYRQPVTRVQIEAIRGVDCSNVLRSLVARGLVEEVGRLDAVGRPIVYGVTELFMQHFGLTELADLPPLGSEDADMLLAATALAEETESENGDSPS